MNRLTGHQARLPASLWTIWAWLMVVLGGVSIAAGIIGGVLAPSVILDIVSFWPLFALAVLLAAAVLPWRKASSRFGAVLPMLLLLVFGVAVSLHLIGWSRLPSAAADLTGPSLDAASIVSLDVELPGRLVVTSGVSALYTVTADREGGGLGVPEALERGGGSEPMSIEIRQRDGGRWFRTNGWSLRLATGPQWQLNLTSPSLDADLRSLSLISGEFSGTGSVLLGSPDGEMTVAVSGAITVEVPPGVVVQVDGSATVPANWETTTDGYRSGGEGAVVTISVTEGSQAVIKQR